MKRCSHLHKQIYRLKDGGCTMICDKCSEQLPLGPVKLPDTSKFPLWEDDWHFTHHQKYEISKK